MKSVRVIYISRVSSEARAKSKLPSWTQALSVVAGTRVYQRREYRQLWGGACDKVRSVPSLCYARALEEYMCP